MYRELGSGHVGHLGFGGSWGLGFIGFRADVQIKVRSLLPRLISAVCKGSLPGCKAKHVSTDAGELPILEQTGIYI